MKHVYMTAIMVSVLATGAAQAAATGGAHIATPQKSDSAAGPCLLGSDTCLGVNKIPVSACHVATGNPKDRNPKDKAACAVDGMRLIGKFTT